VIYLPLGTFVTFVVEENTASAKSSEQKSVQAERSLVLDVFIGDRTILVSQIKQPSYDDADAYADQEKHPVRRKGYQYGGDDHRGDHQAGGPLHVNGHPRKHESTNEIVVPEEIVV